MKVEPTIKTPEEIKAIKQGGMILARINKMCITVLDKILGYVMLSIAKIPAPASARK